MCIFLPLMPGIPGCRTVVLQEHTDRFMAEPSDQQELYAHRETVDHIEVLITEAEKYFRSEPARLQELADEILSLSTPINYNRGIAYGEYYTGRVLYLHSEFEKALPHYTTALQMFEEAGNVRGIQNLLRNVGLSHQMLSQYDKALHYYRREEDFRSSLPESDPVGMAGVVTNIATMYLLLGQHDIALQNYLQALELLKEQESDRILVSTLGNIANLHMSLSEYNEAMKYLHKALVLCQKNGDKITEAHVFLNMGWNHLECKRYSESLECSFNALKVFEELGDRKQKAIMFLHIGQAYMYMHQYSDAKSFFDKSYVLAKEVGNKRTCSSVFRAMGDLFSLTNDNREAVRYYEQALGIMQEIGVRQDQYELYETLAQVEERLGNTDKALYHYRNYMSIKEEVLDERRRQAISEMQIRLNVEQAGKEKEIYRLRNVELADALEKVEALNKHLSEANNEKNELLGIVAHDLKNPISGLSLSLSMLNNYLPRMSQGELSKQILQMNKTVLRMEQIVSKLLDINIIDSGKITFQPTVFNLNEAIQNVVDDYTDRMREKNITVHIDLAMGDLKVNADRVATLEVLDNLISNAVKYSYHNSVVIVRSLQEQEMVRFEVQDSGPGIDPADYDKLFKKFVRLEAKPTGGESSTGLGLSIVKKLVDIMNGKVWCESRVNHGSVFVVTLPART